MTKLEKVIYPAKAHTTGGRDREACFACHKPQKAQDYVFSTYIP
jgi:hypothetical protein